MKAARAANGFMRAPGRRRRLAAEAAAELLRARVRTLLPARHYTRDFGTITRTGTAGEVGPEQRLEAARIGRMVAAVARYMPFRALCLQQAIAVRRMLARRGVPAAVLLGVARDQRDRAQPGAGRAAHAWVEVGGMVVSGAGELSRYAVVARFA